MARQTLLVIGYTFAPARWLADCLLARPGLSMTIDITVVRCGWNRYKSFQLMIFMVEGTGLGEKAHLCDVDDNFSRPAAAESAGAQIGQGRISRPPVG